MQSVGFIGGGNMGLALAKAIRGRFPERAIRVCELRPERRELFLREIRGAVAADTPAELAASVDIVFLAVKPQDYAGVLAQIADTDRLVISIAAGVRLERLEAALPRARVVRVMPNTPCQVGAMAAGYALGARVGADERRAVEQLLEAAGYAAALPEELLDAVTGVSGSGPAFVARLIEAFVAAGRELGLPADVARELTLKTFEGTARLLHETGMEPQALVDMVSSPNGTTVAGRRVLEAAGVREALIATLQAAAARSRELGR